MSSISTKIAFLGCGNMAEALIKGLLDRGISSKDKILGSDVLASRKAYIKNKYKIRVLPSNKELIASCDVIILALKPQVIDSVLLDTISTINSNKLIISIAAGVNIKHLQKFAPKARVIRVMPNTPALVGKGITVMCKSKTATTKDFHLARKIFASVGEVVEADESVIDIVTATSGSGPAYFFLLMDAMIATAHSLGLKKDVARKLVINTAIGSGALALKSSESLKGLIKKVASKGGTTEAALKIFKSNNFEKIVKQAVEQATKRSKELSK